MPPATRRGKPNELDANITSDPSETAFETYGTVIQTAPGLKVFTPPSCGKNESLGAVRKVPITKFSQKTHSDGKTVTMSIGTPRLTANGKRIGRPPGTFKVIKEPAEQKEVLDKPTICGWDSCGKELYTVESVVHHVYSKHVNKRGCVCRWDGCNFRVFKSYYMLVSHLRCHTGERPQKCDFPGCIKAYKTKENLNTHRRSHTGEKPFHCQFTDVCDKTFTNASDRGKHENRCHTNKKEYYCDIGDCYKRYTDPSSLRKHVVCIHGREFLKNRTKIKVRWVYRRDGLPAYEGTKEVKKEESPVATPGVTNSPILPLFAENQFLLPSPSPQPLRLGERLPGSAFRKVLPRLAPVSPFIMNPISPNIILNNNPNALLVQYLRNQIATLPQCSPIPLGIPQPLTIPPIPQLINLFSPPSPMIPQLPLISQNFGFNGNLLPFGVNQPSIFNASLPPEVLIRHL